MGPFPVVIEPGFWLISALIGMNSRAPGEYVAAFVFVLFVSILVHELGHAIAVRAFGGSAFIRLTSFAGLTFPDRTFTPGKSIVVSLAGPGAGFALGGVVLLLEVLFPPRAGFGTYVFEIAKWINFIWGAVNLLPVLPLDGGNVLATLLGAKRMRTSLLIGGVAAVLATLVFARYQLVFAAVMFGFFALRNFMAYSELGAREGRTRAFARPEMADPSASGRAWELLHRGELEEARRIAETALVHTRPSPLRNDLLDVLAWVAMADGDRVLAQKRLDEVQPPKAIRALTQALVHDANGNATAALPFARTAFVQEPSDTSAGLAARSALEAGTVEEAERIVGGYVWKNAVTRDSLLAQVALRRADYPLAAQLAEAAFVGAKRPNDAYNAARATAQIGDLPRSTLWLKHALDQGFEDLDALEGAPELEPIRADPEVSSRLRALRAPVS